MDSISFPALGAIVSSYSGNCSNVKTPSGLLRKKYRTSFGVLPWHTNGVLGNSGERNHDDPPVHDVHTNLSYWAFVMSIQSCDTVLSFQFWYAFRESLTGTVL